MTPALLCLYSPCQQHVPSVQMSIDLYQIRIVLHVTQLLALQATCCHSVGCSQVGWT
jgi:hypothetical protein